MLKDLKLTPVLDGLADLVVVADLDNRIVYANPAVERLLGRKPEELQGQRLSVLVPERLRAAHEAGMARYARTGAAKLMGRPVRVPALHRDGSERDVELTLARLEGGAGEPLVIATLRDLSDRVELERQRYEQRLLAAQYEVMLALSRAVSEREAAGGVLEALGRSLGWRTGNFLAVERAGEGPGELRLLAHWQHPEAQLLGFEAATRRRSFALGEGLPGRAWQAGAPLWSMDVSADPRFSRVGDAERAGLRAGFFFPVVAEGHMHGVLEFFSHEPKPPDEALLKAMAALGAHVGQYFERLRLEQERQRHLEREQLARAEAQAALRAREEFLSIASHELRTPVSALVLQLEALRRGAGHLSTEQLLTRTETARRGTQRLQRLVEVLLDVSRSSYEPMELRLELEQVDLAALAREVAGRFAEQLAQAGCALHVHAPEPVLGTWDALRLEQVVTNLLSNAAKYGAGHPVELRVGMQGASAWLSVRDGGIGIAPEDQGRLFERFGRVVSERHYGGFGLGLWIVRRICEALGGSVGVQSAAGQGSLFTVELPLAGPARRPLSAVG
jgi:PAS domain S-box-containing protein